MLLLKQPRSTVVYIRRSIKLTSWYYEFVPTPKWVAANAYPEEFNKLPYIASLKQTSTYYVVDPGRTKESCNPGTKFKPRLIIISSPDESHWGGGDFQKLRGKKTGVVQYYPLWTLKEVRHGLEYFSSDFRLSPQQLAERYRRVGGVATKPDCWGDNVQGHSQSSGKSVRGGFVGAGTRDRERYDEYRGILW